MIKKMTKLEKALKGLECCVPEFPQPIKCSQCPYEKNCYHEGRSGLLLRDALELLKNLKELEKKYTSLLNEKMSELMDENTKLNLEMNQTISERLIHTRVITEGTEHD